MKRTPLKRQSDHAPADQALYRAYRKDLWLRCQGRCENPGCGAMAHDAHHTAKPRTTNHGFLVALCRSCHTWVDAPVGGRRGRLRITAGRYDGGRFFFTFKTNQTIVEIPLRTLSPGREGL